MCEPISIGIAVGAGIGAAGAAATGGDPLMGAVMGGIGGGLSGGLIGPGAGLTMNLASTMPSLAVSTQLGVAGGIVGGVGSTLTGVALDFLTPKAPTFDVPQQTSGVEQLQQFSSQHIATTGSGGKQAAASLAEAVRRSKKRNLTQEDVDDLSIDTSSFASVGLQLA